jgi:SAM-dependent methyltransferase
MASYDVFAPFYDAVQGDRAEHAAYLRELIERHHPGAATLLELACGTGSLLAKLAPRYRVTGVDASPRMLEQAARKLRGTRLIEADMRRVSLGARFDVVLCAYDSVNHLPDFAGWEQLFDRACEHLAPGGVFVFDMNTEHGLAVVQDEPPWVHWFGDGDLLVMNVRAGVGGATVWEVRVFERADAGRYRLHAEDIVELAFPRRRVASALRRRFARVWTYDQRRARPGPRSERLHFVCEARTVRDEASQHDPG